MPRNNLSLFKLMRHHMALASMLLPGTVLACFCPPEELGEFLHLEPATIRHPASITLPANARGVLFLFERYPEFVVGDDEGYFIVHPPVPLSAKRFRIRERDTGRSLSPQLVRLQVEKQMGTQWEGFFLGSPEMRQCSKPANTSKAMCRTLESLKTGGAGREQDEYSDRVKRFASQHGLLDISEEVNAAAGLYRVEAREGFKPDRVYEIEYREGKRRLKAELRMGIRSMDIDGDAAFTVRTDGSARREKLLVANAGTCGKPATMAVQPLRLTLPTAYEPYRPQLLYFMQHKLQQADRRQFTPVGRYTPFHYLPTVCTTIPHGGSFHGNGRELALGDCQAPAPRQVKAYAGMLEVEDRLHETAPLTITFPAEKPGQCPNMLDEVYPIYFVPSKAG
ncbi:hypothetical protein ACQ4WM_20255 [Janthinobacterium sp. RB2R34]